MNRYDYNWPDPQAILDELEEVMTDHDQSMVLRSRDDFDAGMARATMKLDYAPDATLAQLGAVMFDGITARHALVDGNKRAGALAVLSFFAENGMVLDVSNRSLYEKLVANVSGELTIDELADWFDDNLWPKVE